MRNTVFLVALTLVGCARSLVPLDEALARLTPTPPEAPLSAKDSVLSLTLEHVVVHGLPDYQPRSRVVISRDRGFASARVLPRLPSITFYMIDSNQIQAFADRYGSLEYLLVGSATAQGDSATADIGYDFAVRRHPGRGPVALGGGGGCYWILRRHDHVWQIERLVGCAVS